jgi:hypothetical protein
MKTHLGRGHMTGAGIALSFAAALLLSACSGSGSGAGGPSSGQGSLPAATDPAAVAAKDLVETKCTLCHTLDRIKDAQHSAAEWQSTVDRMRQHGAVIADDEAKQIVDYLGSE